MAKSDTKSDKEVRSTQDINFDQARETARINAERDSEQQTSGAYDGVEVRESKPVEVINPVRNASTGELEDDTRTIKSTPEEQVGANIPDVQKAE